jgi:hypothetical protein
VGGARAGDGGELVEGGFADVRLGGPERGVTEQELRAADTGLPSDVIGERVPHQVRVKVGVDTRALSKILYNGPECLPRRRTLP